MQNTLVLHSIPDELLASAAHKLSQYTVFSALPPVKPCIGCFACWVKTPGKCIIPDRAAEFLTLLPQKSQLLIISKMYYGSLAPEIKNLLDRSIGFLLPFFTTIQGEMHHKQRYKKTPQLVYWFYGDNITENEKSTARKLAAANALNFGSSNPKVEFFSSAEALLEVLA